VMYLKVLFLMIVDLLLTSNMLRPLLSQIKSI
jgi:hypothetical protein